MNIRHEGDDKFVIELSGDEMHLVANAFADHGVHVHTIQATKDCWAACYQIRDIMHPLDQIKYGHANGNES